MESLKITLVHGDLANVECSIVFMKHIEGSLSMPEQTFDKLLNGALFKQYEENEQMNSVIIPCENLLLHCQIIYIINFHKSDLPFRYSSVEKYAKKIIEVVLSNDPAFPHSIKKIATAIHGPGAGLDASEAMETFLVALANELNERKDFGELEEIIFVEKDKGVFERLEERIKYLSSKGTIKFFDGAPHLMPMKEATKTSLVKELNKNFSANHIFIAMPFAKEFNNVYYFGIKQTVERFNRKSERNDQDKFVGDVVQRIKERIKTSDLVIADITGHNPNVFYEVGLADGLGKKIILISQVQDIPFDFRTQSQIIYDNQDILGLSAKLEEMLSVILNKTE